MGISKEEYYGVPEYEDVYIDMSSVDTICGESLVYTDINIVPDISTIATSAAITANTISINSYNPDADITIEREGKTIQVGAAISELTIQVEVMAEMLHELAASGKFDISEFDINRRVEQKRMLKRLSGE
jgi:hypothetical protein